MRFLALTPAQQAAYISLGIRPEFEGHFNPYDSEETIRFFSKLNVKIGEAHTHMREFYPDDLPEHVDFNDPYSVRAYHDYLVECYKTDEHTTNLLEFRFNGNDYTILDLAYTLEEWHAERVKKFEGTKK
jgi:hypothetical protein